MNFPDLNRLGHARVKILLIEDNEAERWLFLQMARDKALPWDIETADTVAAARDHLTKSDFDVIVADNHLPDAESTELFGEIPDIPFVMVTGTLEEQLALRTLERGADDYLVKDVEHRYLEALPFTVEKTLCRKAFHEREQRLTRDLLESEERLAAFMQNLPGAAWIKDLDGRYVSINPELERIFGASMEEVRGKRDSDFLPPATAQQFQENDRRVLTEGNSLRTTEVLRQSDGVDHTFVVRKFALKGPDGQPAYFAGVAFDVTERLRAEEALRESEQRLRAMFENLASGIIQTDNQDRFVAVNERLCRMLGYSREELLAKSVHELTYPEDRPRSDKLNAQLHEGLLSWFEYEKRYLKRDGSPLWVHVSVSAVRDDAGHYLFSVGTVVDISGRKAAEAQLRLQAAALEAAPNAISISETDPKGTIVWVNSAFTRLTGYSAEEAIGQSHHVLSSGLQDEAFYRNLWEMIARGDLWRGELVNRRKDGTLYYEEMGITPLRDEDGVITHYVAAKQDITARKQAEQELRQALERYERQVRLFDGIASTTPDFVYVFDRAGRFVYANRRLLEVWGMKLPDVIGKTCRELGYAQWHHDMHMQEIAQVIETKYPIKGEVPFKAPLTGIFGIYEYIFTPVIGPDGEVELIAGTTRDVTGRKRTEQALEEARKYAEKARADAEQASQAKDHFLAVLSHELRTPLTPVAMGISMLQEKPGFDAEVRETLEMVRQNVEMEARLIDDLLDVTRIARGKVELNRSCIELYKVIQRAVEVCKPDIEARGLHFGVDMGPSAPYWINVDPARLQQVFWNLLNNAIKFTPHGGCIGIRCLPNEKHVLIEVNDSGIGIEPEALQRVFNAFEQAERSITRQFGGLGLGLTISKALVEMHGGSIEAHSNGRNRGATFRIQLPLSAPAEQSETFAAVSSPPQASRPLHILLVEDHGATARMIGMVLREKGHNVETAGDMATALELADKNSFDLLVSDLGLPDGTGHTLMLELRARGHKFPGIALSGYGQEDAIRRTYEAGFAAHLTKPASRQRLLEVVASVAAGDGNGISMPASSVSFSAEVKVFDRDEALKRCFGNRETLKEMMDFFPKESMELLGKMHSALDQGDLAETGRAAHRLKGSVVYLGAQPATEAAIKIEQASKSGNLMEACQAILELEHEVELLKKALASDIM